MPDTIPCGHAVVVQARDEQKGADAERKWLDAYYPHHGDHAQALQMNGDKRFDVLTFKRANGRDASVCFDITSFYGRF